MKHIILTLVAIAFCSSIFVSCENNPTHGKEIIQMMKDKYNNKWYTHFTFSQHVNDYKNGKVVSQTVWHEAYSFPSQIAIKFDSYDSGEGLIFKNDSMFYMKDNKVASQSPKIHDVVVIGFDAYEQDINIVLSKLDQLGYDLNKVFETKVDGRDAYCIGALSEDEKSNRFYIDKERLYFLKYVKYFDGLPGEMHFTNYRLIEGKWVATKILFIDNGELVMDEEYFNMAFPEHLDNNIYDPKNFEKMKW